MSGYLGQSQPVALANSPSEEKVLDMLTRRNKIINGNFDIWQRGLTQTSRGYGSDDRWNNDNSGSTKTHSLQSFTVGQTDVPGNPSNYSRTVVTSVAGAGNYVLKEHRIEGVENLSGETVTLSFWAKADSTKNMAIELFQNFGSGGSPSLSVIDIGVTTIALTTSWQKFEVVINVPSISGKVLGSDINSYLGVIFWFDAGSNYNPRNNSLGQQSGIFDIAQVQLEAGSVATPFERRSIGEELALCQRYYEKSYNVDVAPGTITLSGMLGEYVGGFSTSTARIIMFNAKFSVAKRAAPTMTFYSPITGASGKIYQNTVPEDINISGSDNGHSGTRFWATQTTATAYYDVMAHFTADAEL